MYYSEPREPTVEDLTVLRIAGPLAAVVIQRHRDVHRLRQSEQRFGSVLEFASIGMALVSLDGRWLRVNQPLCQIVGYPADELLRIDIQTISHPDDINADLQFLREMLAGHRSHYATEKRYIHKAGHIIWILLSVSLMREENGAPLLFISQIQDISERKRLEQALGELTSTEQQQLGRDLHDGLVTTCRDIVRGVFPLTESQGGLAEGIQKLVNRAATLGTQNVRFSAAESSPMCLTWYARNQLYRIVQEALHNAFVHAEATAIEVTLAIDRRIVRVSVADNGKGRTASTAAFGGVGIEAMRHRAAALRAQLRIEPGANGGTVVICDCPQTVAEPFAVRSA